MVGKRQKGNIDLVTLKKCELKKVKEVAASVLYLSLYQSLLS